MPIEVLIDREAVLSGAAAAGEPWQHYDIGHGYCSYTVFEQCPHRLACARCDFYIPKPSGKAQMLEAKADVDRRLALIPLTCGERAAIERDSLALDRLLDRVADTPTPTGPTPRELAARPHSVSTQRDAEISASIAGPDELTTLTGVRNPINQPFEDRTRARVSFPSLLFDAARRSGRRSVGTPLVPTSHARHGAQGWSRAPRLLARRERATRRPARLPRAVRAWRTPTL